MENLKQEQINFKDQFNGSMILSQNFTKPLNNEDSCLTNNTLVLGATGSGKDYNFVIPNIMTMNANYVVTDPKCDLYEKTAEELRNNGYDVKVINTYGGDGNAFYNPLTIIKETAPNAADVAIYNLARAIIKNNNNDSFFTNNEVSALAMLLYYVYATKENASFLDVAAILDKLITCDDVVSKYKELENEVHKYSVALKLAPPQQMAKNTLKSILLSVSLNISEIVKYTEIAKELEPLHVCDITKKKCALFIQFGSERKQNIVSTLLYQLLSYAFNASTSIERHVSFILDEFANIGGTIEQFASYITAIKDNVSINIILQSIEQLKVLYPNDWKLITNIGCSVKLILGFNSYEDAEFIATFTEDDTESKELYMFDRKNKDKCLILEKDSKPIMDDKFNIRNYINVLSDSFKKNMWPREYC